MERRENGMEERRNSRRRKSEDEQTEEAAGAAVWRKRKREGHEGKARVIRSQTRRCKEEEEKRKQ